MTKITLPSWSKRIKWLTQLIQYSKSFPKKDWNVAKSALLVILLGCWTLNRAFIVNFIYITILTFMPVRPFALSVRPFVTLQSFITLIDFRCFISAMWWHSRVLLVSIYSLCPFGNIFLWATFIKEMHANFWRIWAKASLSYLISPH